MSALPAYNDEANLLLTPPQSAFYSGFVGAPGGTHTSRTMMLAELRLLLAACAPESAFSDYEAAIVDDNVLVKPTITTRRRTLRGLRELYALDPMVLLFRALRDLWAEDEDAQPLLALLCAVARDPTLRATVPLLVATPPSAVVTPQLLADAVRDSEAGRYNQATLDKIGRNAASSWQQSGHLQGRVKKTRSRADARPGATAYALLLGYLCGARGEALFSTAWAALIDAPPALLHSQAAAASQRGWLEYRHAGAVTDISFRYLLRGVDQEMLNR